MGNLENGDRFASVIRCGQVIIQTAEVSKHFLYHPERVGGLRPQASRPYDPAFQGLDRSEYESSGTIFSFMAIAIAEETDWIECGWCAE